MKCVHYEIYTKSGKLMLKNFGWFNKNTDVEKYLKNEWKKAIVKIIK